MSDAGLLQKCIITLLNSSNVRKKTIWVIYKPANSYIDLHKLSQTPWRIVFLWMYWNSHESLIEHRTII